MLLVADSGLIDAEAIARAVRLIRSTSPSALLMASLDAARRQLAVHGNMLLDGTITASIETRAAIDAIAGCRVVDEQFVGAPGIAGWDPLRIVIDVRGTGCTGYEVAGGAPRLVRHLHRARHPRDARARARHGPANEPLERLAHDLAETVRLIARPGALERCRTPSRRPRLTAGDPPRRVPRSERGSAGRAGGRPDLNASRSRAIRRECRRCCRRAVSAEVVAYLRALTNAGARLHGAADPTFATVRVLVG